MPDITLFEADLSGSKFVAPFGHYHEGEEYRADDEDGGRNWKLLGGLAVVGLAALGGAAFFLKRKFAGGDADEDDEFEAGAEGRFGFDEEFDVEDPEADDEDGAYEFDREPREESESRKGAVAAVVGLLFLLLVTALVKRRRSDDAAAVEVDVAEPDRATAAEHDR